MPPPAPDLQSLTARWFVFAQMLIAFARQMTALDYTGAVAALHKAELVDVMAQLALTEVIRDHAAVRALASSPERDAALDKLRFAAQALTVVRAVASNVKNGRAAQAQRIGAMALDYGIANDAMPLTKRDQTASIDSS